MLNLHSPAIRKIATWLLLGLMAISLRIPMIVTEGCNEDWKDVWIWENFKQPMALCSQSGTSLDGTTLPVEVQHPSTVRWPVLVERQIAVLVCELVVLIPVLFFPERTSRARLWAVSNPRSALASISCLLAAALLLYPPCIEPAYSRYSHPTHTYCLLWTRTTEQLDYQTLIVEVLILTLLTIALSLIFSKQIGPASK